MGSENLAGIIDHTLLRPDASEEEIRRLCEEAAEYRFKTVCLEAKWLPLAVAALRGTGVLPITVISFPHGTLATALKVDEAKAAAKAGAREIDMVLNRGLLREKEYRLVEDDIAEVVRSVPGVPVKVILETSELTDEEKAIACALAKAAGAAFVKTSTGFSKGGATADDVALMRRVVGDAMGVKASGGIRSHADALRMVRAGATRLGTSASVAIATGAEGKGSY